MIISIIAALSDNRVIGNKNRIPWHIKEDLIRFKEKTLHHTAIMGRTTFESLMEYYKKSGRPLPERRHVIISRDTNYIVSAPNCFVVHSVDEALKCATEKETEALSTAAVAKGGLTTEKKGEVFISGGASIFEQTINIADRLYLTVVHKQVEGDTYFPDYSAFSKVVGKKDHVSPDGTPYTFLDLGR